LGEPLPWKTTDGKVEQWLFNVDINAKNGFGGYAGYRLWTIVIRNGKVISADIVPEGEVAKGFRERSKAAR